MTGEAWYASAAIGVAASLGGMIWAFRRGVLGVLANFAAGIGGALVGSALAPGPPHFFFAGVGAIAALLLLHVGWAGLLVWRGRQAPAR